MPAIRKAFECSFHTPADVRGYLADALEIVESLDLPDELSEPAYVQAVGLLAQKQITFEEVSGAGVLLNHRPQG